MFRARNIRVRPLTYVLRGFRGVSVRCLGNSAESGQAG